MNYRDVVDPIPDYYVERMCVVRYSSVVCSCRKIVSKLTSGWVTGGDRVSTPEERRDLSSVHGEVYDMTVGTKVAQILV